MGPFPAEPQVLWSLEPAVPGATPPNAPFALRSQHPISLVFNQNTSTSAKQFEEELLFRRHDLEIDGNQKQMPICNPN